MGWRLAKIVEEELSMQGQGWDKKNHGQLEEMPSEPTLEGFKKHVDVALEDKVFWEAWWLAPGLDDLRGLFPHQ